MTLDTIPRWLILAGFLINAGAPPLSAWLPDAYPESSWSGMVFLSAFTTKAAVYVLMRGFPGAEFLIYVGLFMVFYGIIYAILENDMRRILAYSIVNQVGFMVVGIGIGTEMALNGAASHAFTHIIYKALLLMSAGSVLYMTGKRKCTDLGGLFRTMPLTAVCGISPPASFRNP
jgi:multicomponent Na+:H+ antiporter subunit D